MVCRLRFGAHGDRIEMLYLVDESTNRVEVLHSFLQF